MQIAKRIFLLILTNILVMVTLSIILNVLGIHGYMTPYGQLDLSSLAAFCLVWGMGGAFISLALSRVMAKWLMGVKIIDPRTNDAYLASIVVRVHHMAKIAGLSVMPEVGIYDSPEINAFATGPMKSRSLVALSSGLLDRMNQDEQNGVIGHELTHVANGDMVTMTLVQGMVNAFTMFLSRVVAFAVSAALRGDRERDRGPGPFYGILVFVFDIVFMIFGAMVVAAFSRYREYRADAGGAKIAGRDNMIRALQALQRNYEMTDLGIQPAVANLKISSKGHGIYRFFSTHPSLSDRIERLKAPSSGPVVAMRS